MHRLPSFVPRSHEGNIFVCRSKGFLDIYFIYKYLAGEDRGLWISIAWAPYSYTGPKNRHYTHRQLYFFIVYRQGFATLRRKGRLMVGVFHMCDGGEFPIEFAAPLSCFVNIVRDISMNSLTTLPTGVFDGLGALTQL